MVRSLSCRFLGAPSTGRLHNTNGKQWRLSPVCGKLQCSRQRGSGSCVYPLGVRVADEMLCARVKCRLSVKAEMSYQTIVFGNYTESKQYGVLHESDNLCCVLLKEPIFKVHFFKTIYSYNASHWIKWLPKTCVFLNHSEKKKL